MAAGIGRDREGIRRIRWSLVPPHASSGNPRLHWRGCQSRSSGREFEAWQNVGTAHGINSVHQLDQMRARWARLERITEVLRLPYNLSVAEFHNAHRVRGRAIVGEHEFRDPKIAIADDPPHG